MTQAALRLKAAKESKQTEDILAAVRINWQLWTILQAEMLDPDCPLPADIRSNGVSLANFIDKHSMELISNPVVAKLDVLININRELAAGLRAVPQTEEAQEESSPAPTVKPGEITA